MSKNHRGKPRHKRKNNDKGKKGQKGPKSPDDERLWRRLIPYIDDFSRSYQKRDLLDLIESKEGLKTKHSSDSTGRNRFESSVLTALSIGVSKGERFYQKEDGIKLRESDEVTEILNKKASWEAFFSRHSKPITTLRGAYALREGEEYQSKGGINLVTKSDSQKYDVIEQIMNCVLNGDKVSHWPNEFFLDENTKLVCWDGFDLVKEVEKFLNKRSGMRFRGLEPHCALLLYCDKKVSAEELLENRLRALKKEEKNPFPRHWDQRHVDSQENIPEVDGDLEVSKGRTDLRHLPFMTIDPHDAKDFDDAVCLVEEDGKRCLWVAIADVANYVVKDSALDNAALNRATSVYLPHAVLPMLPPRLADDLCSLRANVDRLAMVIALHLDEDSNIIETKAYEAVIHVDENLAYEDALEQDRFSEMMQLADLWRSREIRLDISTAEVRPRLKSDGISLQIKWPNRATQMIESFMVATNSAVAHMLGKEGASVPYRCHTPPDRPEVTALNAKISALGLNIELPMPSHRKVGQDESEELNDLLSSWAGSSISMEIEETSEDEKIQDYMSTVVDSEARKDMLKALAKAQKQASELDDVKRRIVDQGLFQLMQRATYSEENLGHFGLDLDAYVHFTSPIRRYPDLMVHRQLKSLIHGKDWVYSQEEVVDISAHCSQRGWESKTIEWELVANTFHMYLLDGGKIGEIGGEDVSAITWSSRVTGLRNPWVFLDLTGDGSIQGRMHLRQLSKQRTSVDEHGIHVIPAEPDHNGMQEPLLTLGQKYPCRLQGVDLWSGQMDLAPI